MRQLEEELRAVLNRNSAENPSGTPDHILAEYLLNCLDAYNQAVAQRSEWHSGDVLFSSHGVKPN